MIDHAPHGQALLRAVQVVGDMAGAGERQVLSLVAGLVARGVRVTVCAPWGTQRPHEYEDAGARHIPVAWESAPASVVALRAACADADLVHAHGLSAALRSALALSGRRTPLVITWHPRPRLRGSRDRLLRLLERRAARAAAVVLGASPMVLDEARERGARDARLAATAFALARPPRQGVAQDEEAGPAGKTRAELGVMERPLVVTVGALEPDGGHDILLDATRVLRGLDPEPLLLIAGEGSLRGTLQRRIDKEGLPVRLLGRRDDVRALMSAADIALLPEGGESRLVVAQEALHARVPLVGSAQGCTQLLGDAVELVPRGDAPALGMAIARLLADPERRERLGDRGHAWAARWPTEDETVSQVLSVYDELIDAGPSRRG